MCSRGVAPERIPRADATGLAPLLIGKAETLEVSLRVLLLPGVCPMKYQDGDAPELRPWVSKRGDRRAVLRSSQPGSTRGIGDPDRLWQRERGALEEVLHPFAFSGLL